MSKVKNVPEDELGGKTNDLDLGVAPEMLNFD